MSFSLTRLFPWAGTGIKQLPQFLDDKDSLDATYAFINENVGISWRGE
jgi:hypothetical protein